ncbi:hypothetical protein EON65_37220 [archaeon]|nr:MAG: hypothetical protein EON65_37220 [archaeon]
MEESGLPILTGPVDHLRQGFQGLQLEAAATAPHPVEQAQRRGEFAYNNKLDMIRRTYGTHMAMRLATEQMVYNRDRRLPGLESSHIAVDTLANTDATIDFKDFLNGKWLHLLVYMYVTDICNVLFYLCI